MTESPRNDIAAPSGIGLNPKVLVGIAFAVVLGIGGWQTHLERQAQQRESRRETRVAREIRNAVAERDSCRGAVALDRLRRSGGARGGEGASELSSLARRCCENRARSALNDVAAAYRSHAGGTRAAALRPIFASVGRDESAKSVLGTCGHPRLLHALSKAVEGESLLESGGDNAWQAVAVLRSAAQLEAAFRDILLPASRQPELAQVCIQGGMAAGRAAQRRRDDQGIIAAYDAVIACARTLEGANLSLSQERVADDARTAARDRIARAAAAAEAAAEAAEARAAAQAAQDERDNQAYRMQALAQQCMSECMADGNSAVDCSADCTRRHPELGRWAADYGIGN